MKKIYIIKGIYFETRSEAQSEERALEVLATVEPILECQKQFWSRRIREMFDEYVCGSADIDVLLKRKKGGLHWQFHKVLLVSMCEAFEE